MKYKFSNKFILRTPTNSLNELELDQIDFSSFEENVFFKKAIRLASPTLYNELEKHLKTEKNKDRLLISLLKYYSRFSTRCTPFGLFAGLCIGEISNKSSIILNEKPKHNTHTRLDMNYLCSLIQDLEKIKEISDELKYFVNNSLYEIGDKIRYVEYEYLNSNRIHRVSSAENNEYLTKVLDIAKAGAYKHELETKLKNEGIDADNASNYVQQLISNQVLTSAIEPTVTGIELFDFLINQLEKINLPNNKVVNELNAIRKSLKDIDNIKNKENLDLYSDIALKLEKIGTKFNENFLFQTDLVLSAKTNTIKKEVLTELSEGLEFLNKITLPISETNLTKFKDAFYERYEDREVPLTLALDVESGIGYLQNNNGSDKDNTPLVDDFIANGFMPSVNSYDIKWDGVQKLVLEKYIDSIKNQEKIIEFKDEDVSSFKANWDDLPSSFYTMVEIVNFKNEERIVIKGVGGSSAVNLLGRFAHADNEINSHIREITQIEEKINKDKILAEIVHLPQSRVGNILTRPLFRKYEIPYLGQSNIEKSNQITIDDILISIKGEKIFLRSKKYNKEIKPHLSNAHNYSARALPIYQFLADMQTQGIRNGLYFNWGILSNVLEFFPRVIYKKIILSEATWIIKTTDFNSIIEADNDSKILIEVLEFQTKKQIPRKVLLLDGDNELFIDLLNILSVKMLISLVKKTPSFKLKEFLFSKDKGIVKDIKGNVYTNEFIFSFYKDEEVQNA